MRLIDADALKSYIDCGHLRPPTELCFSELDVVRMLDRQSTIDAEPVRHGRWIRMDDSFARWRCSECGAIESHSGWEYCHCGAKMRCGDETE